MFFSFEDLLNVPEQYQEFSRHEGILSIMRGLPFTTEFIGIIRDDVGKIVCLEGHHRATAIALGKKQGNSLDFSNANITIALAHLPKNEVYLLDEMVKRGSSKIPEN